VVTVVLDWKFKHFPGILVGNYGERVANVKRFDMAVQYQLIKATPLFYIGDVFTHVSPYNYS
jgi:hypothetical protein